MDGTLLNSKNEINVQTKNKIQDLNHKGIPFILVSARMLKGMDFIQRELGMQAPLICYRVALVYDENQNIIYSKSFSLEKAKSMLIRLMMTFKKKQTLPEWNRKC